LNSEVLKEIIYAHGKWLCNEKDGKRANLCRADLRGADLRGADLPEQIVQVGPIGSRKDYTIYWIDRDIVQCGCWNNFEGGSLDEFKKRIDDVYPDGKYRDEYLAAIAMFEALKKHKEQEGEG